MLIVAEGSEATVQPSSAHCHGRGQLVGLHRGLLSIGTDEGVHVMPATHATWLPPMQLHWGHAHGPFLGWSVYIAEDACAALPASVRTIRVSPLLREAIVRAATWPVAPLNPSQTRLAGVIMDEIATLPVEPCGLPLPREPRLLRIAAALVARPEDERGLDEWARWGGVSARTLSRRFVSETGFSFSAWRQRARMMRSLEMLAAGRPVTAIALDLGYASPSAFISAFHRTFGETPKRYRERL